MKVNVAEEMKKAMDTGVKVNQVLATHYAKKPKNTISMSDSEPSDSEPSDSEPSDSEPSDSKPSDSEPSDSLDED